MGFYSRVCAVSNTPILENQKARVFYLVMNVFELNYYKKNFGLFKSSFSMSHCYPNKNYKIIGYPLLATYNEDSLYDFSNKNMESLMLSVINESYLINTVAEGKELSSYNSYHDFMNIDKLDSMNTVQKMIKCGSLRVKTSHGISSVVEMAIHEDIYQELILKDGWDSTYFNSKKITFDSLVQDTYDKYIKSDSLIISDSDKFQFDSHKRIIQKRYTDQDLIDKYIKLYLDDLKSYGLYDKGSNDNINTTLTNQKRDIQIHPFPNDIIEAWIGSEWTFNWFQSNNMQFHSPISSVDDDDYKKHAKRLKSLAKIVKNFSNNNF